MIKEIIALFVMVCLVLQPVGTARAQLDYHELILLEEDAGQTVAVGPYDVLTIALRSNPSTGYTWMPVEIPSFLTKVDEAFVPHNDLLGSSGELMLRFVSNTKGQGTIRFEYRRPWEQQSSDERTYTLSVTTDGAFLGTYQATPSTGVRPERQADSLTAVTGADLPTKFNWCDYGGCSSVKDQGVCGSCWAFATVGAVESDILLKDGTEKDLSEQYLVSCNIRGYNCVAGWWVHDHFISEYISGEQEAGAVYESDFPYAAIVIPCNPPHQHHEQIDDYGYVGPAGEVASAADIKQAIYRYGPVSTALYIGNAFNVYRAGIFSIDEGLDPNHGVVITGWDESGPVSYWHIKNSWGSDWGEEGYMRIQYGASLVGYGAVYTDYKGPYTGPRAHILAIASPYSPTVDFVDESTCDGCSISVRSWNFGDGSSSVEQRPFHTYAASGTYPVTLTVSTSVSETDTIVQNVTVPKEYCPAGGEAADVIWIGSVDVGEFSNASGPAQYSDFTERTYALNSGQTYPVTIAPGNSDNSNWFCLWIDFDRDGTFYGTGEKVFQSNTAHQGNAQGTIVIPELTGSFITRMRVAVKNTTLLWLPAPEPCERYAYGEVEDYSVVINPGLAACSGDLDLDFDIDGSDLAIYAASGGIGIDLAAFAGSFGSVSCP